MDKRKVWQERQCQSFDTKNELEYLIRYFSCTSLIKSIISFYVHWDLRA